MGPDVPGKGLLIHPRSQRDGIIGDGPGATRQSAGPAARATGFQVERISGEAAHLPAVLLSAFDPALPCVEGSEQHRLVSPTLSCRVMLSRNDAKCAGEVPLRSRVEAGREGFSRLDWTSMSMDDAS